jgi:cohesin complex subunit SCC1
MFYSQVILAKKGPLAKVWLAAHWGDKKLARPQIFATDISQSVESIVNPSVPLALRVSGHLLLGVVRIYSRKVKYVLTDCTEAMLKLQMAFAPRKELLEQETSSSNNNNANLAPFGEFDQVHIVEGFCLPLPDQNEWILAEDNNDNDNDNIGNENDIDDSEEGMGIVAISTMDPSPSTPTVFQPPQEETWVPFDPNDDEEEDGEVHGSLVSDVEVVRAADESFLSGDQVRTVRYGRYHRQCNACMH